MDDRSQTRREMHQVLNGDGERPAPSLGITRRTFLHRSLLAGAGLGIGTHGWFPLINTVDLAFGASEFKFAWISDTHLYPKSVNTRFVDTAVRELGMSGFNRVWESPATLPSAPSNESRTGRRSCTRRSVARSTSAVCSRSTRLR